MTITVGTAVCDESTGSASQLVDKADRALRQAKSQGKDRTVVA